MKQPHKTTRPTATAGRKPPLRRRVAETATGEVIEMVPRVLGIQRILVPLDFSKPAEKALHYAVSFARQCDSKITMLHVRPLPHYGTELGYIPATLPADEPSGKAIKDRLAADARRLVPPGMLDRTLVRVGTAFDEICSAAGELRADLIIISTHGYTGIKHALLGSTAERVVRHAPCPVLVVREREHEFAGAEGARL